MCRVVVRQGLQYGLAKNGIRTLQVVAILICALVTGLLLRQNWAGPRLIMVIVVEVLVVLGISRLTKKLGAWTDRRFFREAYDAEQVLSELSDGVRGMVESRSLIETVAERISETLHIPRVAVLLGGAGPYRPAYALGYGAAPDIAFPRARALSKCCNARTSRRGCTSTIPIPGCTANRTVTEDDRSKLSQARRRTAASSEHAGQIAGVHQPGAKAFRGALFARRPTPAQVSGDANWIGVGECAPDLSDCR